MHQNKSTPETAEQLIARVKVLVPERPCPHNNWQRVPSHPNRCVDCGLYAVAMVSKAQKECAHARTYLPRLAAMVEERDWAIKDALHALRRLKSGVRWDESPEWFDEIEATLDRIAGGGEG